ncbi:Bug family tripartite tricarboxylate transporter substrate binding protein [Paracidovorax konjaci]|uniref:Tripartite-type tricarboxylate transporter, receptor component TctC n=1 Tax=Paracidovorax konjaci TaxID=32040 RepID=A0A1I1VPU6_9BURK|nr:tripartite tricarboxylate transporter substrate-binding protein [Paracidovorax konjaci]SFD82530.1 Tripartite-type tricarboxylate transporter, receptor component TctC [Paracidovorax konjaci]
MLRRSYLLAVLMAGAACAAQAQNASAPLTIVVPYPAGGPLDTSARILADGVRGTLGTVEVQNKPGAGGNTGADLVAKAPKDGNLLVMGAVATHAVNPWLYKSFPYDPLRDFKPIALVARTPNVLVMGAEQAKALNIETTTDLVQYLKKHPDQLKYGSGGNGSIGHIAAEMFKSLTNTRIAHVPFQGSAPALKALQAQEVAFVFDNLASSLPLIKAGKLKALGVTTLGRDDELPQVRSINDEVPGFNVVTWFGLFAPAALPDAAARKYASAFTAAMQAPASAEKLKKMGLDAEDLTLESFGQFVRSEHAKYGFLIKAAKIKMD